MDINCPNSTKSFIRKTQNDPFQVLNVLVELFFFILIILYVFLGIGLELFAIADGGPSNNYFADYDCHLVSDGGECGCDCEIFLFP